MDMQTLNLHSAVTQSQKTETKLMDEKSKILKYQKDLKKDMNSLIDVIK